MVEKGNGTPLQHSCLENPMDGGAWWAAVHGVVKSWTRLRDFTFTFHFHALEKEMATDSSVLAWRIPGTGEPGGLPSMGSHRVRQDWSDLAAAGYGNQYWPMRSSILACGIPSLTEKPDRTRSTGPQRVGQDWSNSVCINTPPPRPTPPPRTFGCGSSAPERIECSGGAAAWLVGTLVGPSVQGHRLPLSRSYGLISFFSILL